MCFHQSWCMFPLKEFLVNTKDGNFVETVLGPVNGLLFTAE